MNCTINFRVGQLREWDRPAERGPNPGDSGQIRCSAEDAWHVPGDVRGTNTACTGCTNVMAKAEGEVGLWMVYDGG